MQIFIKCLDKIYTLDIEQTDTYQDFLHNFYNKVFKGHIPKHPIFFSYGGDTIKKDLTTSLVDYYNIKKETTIFSHFSLLSCKNCLKCKSYSSSR